PRGRSLLDQALPSEVPAGLPSELLQRRPDIVQVEQQLAAATARIGAAKAERFPKITLTGILGVASPQLSRIVNPGQFAELGPANLRYQGGVANYLDVLIAQQSLFDAELSLTATRRLHLVSIVQLYRALGGGWVPDGLAQASPDPVPVRPDMLAAQ